MANRPQSRIRPGDRVYVQGMPVMALLVVDTSAPALVTLRPSGAILKVNRQLVIPARDSQEALSQPTNTPKEAP